MRYEVTDKFYNMLSALYVVALEDENPIEIDMVTEMLMDTARAQDEL